MVRLSRVVLVIKQEFLHIWINQGVRFELRNEIGSAQSNIPEVFNVDPLSIDVALILPRQYLKRMDHMSPHLSVDYIVHLDDEYAADGCSYTKAPNILQHNYYCQWFTILFHQLILLLSVSTYCLHIISIIKMLLNR